MTPEEFHDFVMAEVTPAEEFRPCVFYSREGDFIEVVLSNESYLGWWIDSYITVHEGRESKQVVGVMIEGVSRLLAGSGNSLRPNQSPRST